MYDHMKLTLISYANKHMRENGHKLQVFSNFTHCPFCRDHAHYWKPGWLIQHNSDYSINNRINVDLEL